jgi:hypothetical protein
MTCLVGERVTMKRFSLLIAILFCIPNSGVAANSWISDKSIKEVSYQSWNNGHYYVEVSLTDNTVYRFAFTPTDVASIAIANGMYSNLLTAVSTGKKISLYVITDALIGSTPGTFGGISIAGI